MNELQPVALERANADLVVTGGRVYCSNRRAFLERDVAVVGDRIAALLDDADAVTGPETTVVSAGDRVVLPGLIDAHTHADIQVTPERAAPALLATGTTAIVSETSGLGVGFGSHGVEILLERTAALPLTAFLALPPQWFVDTFDSPRGDDADLEAMADLLEHERVVGVGETDWIHVVGRDAPLERLYDRAREADATIVGHGAGCRGEALRAFATVVDNDHEAVTADGVRRRAANGLHVVGRCGSTRDDLEAVVDAYPDVDRGALSLSTDGVSPPDLRDGFGMAEVVRRLIDAGIPAADAIDAATRTPADHFGLGNRGVVAPGAVADLAVVDDLESMAVECVVADGSVVVTDGTPDFEPPTGPYPEAVRDTVSLDLGRDRFTAPLEAAPEGTVRAMAVDQGLVTTETTVEPAIAESGGDADGGGAAGGGRDGSDERRRLVPDPANDVLTATLLDRDPETDDRGFTGFLTGMGLESGAIATTVTWETAGLVTVAADTADAVTAAERVASMGGGFAVARDGEIAATLATPVAAAAADAPLEDVADGFEELDAAIRDAGCDLERPLLTIQTLTFLGVPALKLTPSGYADVLGRSPVGLEVESDDGNDGSR